MDKFHVFPRRKEGILRDVFIQKAVVVWDSAPSNRIMVSLLLPGPMEMDQWPRDVRASINMWPLQKTAHVMTSYGDLYAERAQTIASAPSLGEN